MSEIKLRPWQKEAHHKALNWWADESNSKNFIINAAPGAGKTLCATFIAKTLLDNKFVDQVVVIAPRSEVVKQWTDDFKLVTNRYMDKVTESQIGMLDDNSDVAATWAALDGLSKHLTKLCRTKNILVICDEHHHAASEASWGQNADSAFSNSKYTLILTGTPVRSDGKDSVWIENGESGIKFPEKGTYTLTYGKAIELGYCRPATFHRHEGKYKVELSDGKEVTVSSKNEVNLPNNLPEIKSLQKALNFYNLACKPQYLDDGVTPNTKGYQASMIEHGIKKLEEIRWRLPNAGGLVIAPNIEMAEYMAKILEQLENEKPILVHSHLTNSENQIEKFKNTDKKWIVSVNMISEGVDIKRLRLLVYLPFSQTELSFRQALGRVVRTYGPDDDSSAYVIMPILETFDEYAKRIEREMPTKFLQEKIVRKKKCPDCYSECELNASVCDVCGYKFEVMSLEHNTVTCDKCGAKNSKYSKECFNCGESFEQLFSISLREALRDGAISRGIKLNEDEVKLGEELYQKKKDLILQSGDAVLIDMIDKLPPEVFGRLKKIMN